jgi:excisionase family DNA binding protein
MEEKEIMTVKQVAKYLQMDEHTIYKLARSGLIPFLKIAGQWRFKKDVIDKWISEESLERVTENIKSSSKKKGKGKNSLWLKKRNIQKQFITGLKMRDHENAY